VFPVFLDLTGKRAVVVGGGPVARAKVEGLLAAGARVTVVAPEIVPELTASGAELIRRPFEPADLDGAWWVVAAATPEVNRLVREAGDVRHVFVNAVDDPEHASAYLGAVLRRDGVVVAISTDGRAPALAGLLREGLDAWLPNDLDAWMQAAEAARVAWRRDGVPMTERRGRLLDVLNGLYQRAGYTQ
jgi:uroporphyrin-III C-methyltransferase / precorrin-2 dehydrogenase / sirohydrochlorin ferrochelatase